MHHFQFCEPIPILSVIGCIAVLLLSRQGHSAEVARGLVFVALVISFLMIIIAIRSDDPGVVRAILTSNKAFRWVVISAVTMLGLAIFVPTLQRVFHFAPLHTDDLLLSIAAGALSVLWVEALEHWFLRRKR